MSIKKIIFPALFSLLLVGCGPDAEGSLSLVKDGTWDGCPQKTLGKMATDYLPAPSWHFLVAEDGRKYVNLSSKITYKGEPVDAVIQFLVHEEGDTFEIHAFEMDGIPQDGLILTALLTNMCTNFGHP